jgi:gamma-glutamylcyclotransferase (GGCT)/AIG2-like uncharacterized protein YtfP
MTKTLTPQEEVVVAMKNAINSNYFTPDMPEILLQDSHYVFCYGTLKHGFPRAEALEGTSKFLGSGWTRSTDMLMYNVRTKDSMAFPVVTDTKLRSHDITDFGPVFGDLYLVDTPTLLLLDMMESNTEMYERFLTNVDVHTKDEGGWKKRSISAWMYFGDPEYWADAKNIRQVKKRGNGYNYSLEMCTNYYTAKDQYTPVPFH